MKRALPVIISLILLFQCPALAAAPIEHRHRAHMYYAGRTYGDVSFNLMYHKISDIPEEQNEFTITSQEFEEDIRYLVSQGFLFKTASELTKVNNKPGSGKFAAITFDDGYSSDYTHALPILEKYNIKATFFVVGALIDTKNYMTSDQLRNLSRSPLVEIGNHTYNVHACAPYEVESVYRNYPLEVIADFDKNADLIKRITGKEPISVSYPYGVYTDSVDAIFSKRGYSRFCSTEYWTQDIRLPFIRFNRGKGRSAEAIHNLLMQRIGK